MSRCWRAPLGTLLCYLRELFSAAVVSFQRMSSHYFFKEYLITARRNLLVFHVIFPWQVKLWVPYFSTEYLHSSPVIPWMMKSNVGMSCKPNSWHRRALREHSRSTYPHIGMTEEVWQRYHTNIQTATSSLAAKENWAHFQWLSEAVRLLVANRLFS